MNDEKDTTRRHLQSNRTCSQNNTSISTKTLTDNTKHLKNYSTNRNCPTIVSLTPFNDHEKQTYRSTKSDKHSFNIVNYAIASSSTTPIPNLSLENNNYSKQYKQPMFPKLTPRLENTVLDTFPPLTARSISLSCDRKNSISSIRTPLRPISISTAKLAETTYSDVSIDDKKRIALRKY